MPDVLDALVDALRAEAEVAGSPLEGIKVFDGEPGGQNRPSELVVVGDVDGDEEPATMRAGGGTRDELYRIEVTVGARKRTDNARVVRRRAAELARRVERVIFDESAKASPLGLPAVRSLLVRGGKDLRQWVLDKERECDVILRVEVKARLSP